MSVIEHPLQTTKEKAEQVVGGPARLQIMFVLGCVLALDTADKATVSALAGSLKDVFGIGNTDIGLLISATSFAGAALTIPIGILVDRYNRRRILLVAVALWTTAMVLSGTASSFIYLLIVRTLLGGVTAAAAPSVASLTGDYFPGRDRASVYGIILAGELLGTGLGFFASGEVASWIDWRWSFYLMGLPSLAILFVIWKWLPEPARGGQSAIEIGDIDVPDREMVKHDPNRRRRQPELPSSSGQAQRQMRREGIRPRRKLILQENPVDRSIWWVIGYLLRVPTYVLLIVASALGYYFFAGIRGFAMLYLSQHYDLTRSTVGFLIIPVGLGALAGVLLSGRLSEHLLRRGYYRARILIPGASLFVSVLLFAPAIWTTNAWIGTALFTFAAGFLAAANPPIDAARLDILTPRMWGRAKREEWRCAPCSKAARPSYSASSPKYWAAAMRKPRAASNTPTCSCLFLSCSRALWLSPPTLHIRVMSRRLQLRKAHEPTRRPDHSLRHSGDAVCKALTLSENPRSRVF